MLFSHPWISDYVRTHFVAAWDSVRPVPKATIDFGNGIEIVRTMSGNVVTYVCDPHGHVVHAIAGVLTVEAYLGELRAAFALAEEVRTSGEAAIAVYHKRMLAPESELLANLATLEPAAAALVVQSHPPVSLGKRAIEDPTKDAFGLLHQNDLLEQDTRNWWKHGARAIHSMLSGKPCVPADLTKPIYGDVLRLDLDDPLLGLSIDVFDGGAYPKETR